MTHEEIMEIEYKVVTVALWIGRIIGVLCFLAVAGYVWGRWA